MKRYAELAWAAGLFEGEGCLYDRGASSGAAKVQMTDLDVIQRFGRIVGAGRVWSDDAPRGPSRKVMHYWQVQNAPDVIRVTVMLMPWFGERRRARAEQLLERLANCPPAPGTRTHCPHGHEYSSENTYVRRSGKRQCRTCHRAGVRRWKQSRRKAAA